MVTQAAVEAAMIADLRAGRVTFEDLIGRGIPFSVAFYCWCASDWRGADEPVTVLQQDPGEGPLHVNACVCGTEFVMPGPAPSRGRCPGCGARYETVIRQRQPGLLTT